MGMADICPGAAGSFQSRQELVPATQIVADCENPEYLQPEMISNAELRFAKCPGSPRCRCKWVSWMSWLVPGDSDLIPDKTA